MAIATLAENPPAPFLPLTPLHPPSFPILFFFFSQCSPSPPLCFSPPAPWPSASDFFDPRWSTYSAMSVGSSSSGRMLGPLKLAAETKLPLVPCPKCGEEILELVAGAGSKVPGAIFFKCRLHDRDDNTSCPWFLFADKYEKMLIANGIVKKGTGGVKICKGDALNEIEQIKIAVGRLEGAVEANKTELTPLLADVVSQKNGMDNVAEKLQKLVDLGKIIVVSLVVAAIFIVLGVIIMFFK